jgi:uncharacterized protein YjdB
MRITLLAPVVMTIGLSACADQHMPASPEEPVLQQALALSPPNGDAAGYTLVNEGFESGSLSVWDDGYDPTRHRIITHRAHARSGRRFLAVTYPVGGDGGWLTKFFMPGFDSVEVSYWVRFSREWTGGTGLLGLYGAPVDNQWGAMGKAGTCPNGKDFFASFVVAEPSGRPGPARFSTYHPGMQPTASRCWGSDGGHYNPPLTLQRGRWHHVRWFVRLNTPGAADGAQRLWINDMLRGEWTGIRFRDTRELMLNAVQLSATVLGGVRQLQRLFVDDVRVVGYGGKPNDPTPTDPPPAPVPVASIVVIPTSATVQAGGTLAFAATARDATGNVLADRDIAWSSADSVVATVDGTGLAKGVREGSTLVIASSEGVNGSASLSVTALPASPPAPVASIAVLPSVSSLHVGGKVQLSATLRDAEGNLLSNRPVIWTSANPAVAIVSATGEVTGVAAGGPVAIIAMSEDRSASAQVTVTAVPVASVTVTPPTGSVSIGATLQLSAVLRDNAGSILAGRPIAWTSTNPTVASVSTTGLVRGIVAGGPVTITAMSEGRSGTAQVTVTALPPPAPPPVVTQIVVTPASVTLAAGGTQQFTATAQMSNGMQQPAVVTWTATGGTVTAAGLYTAGTNTGSYRVIATQQGGTLADTSAITISAPPPPPPGGGTLAWFEDFRTSLTDKGLRWFIATSAAINRVPKSVAPGSWPSELTHVAENIYAAEHGAAYQAQNLWPAPAVGQYLFGRLLVSNALPNGANTGGDHGFQANAIAPIPWFWRVWGGNATSFQLDATTWDHANRDELNIVVPKNTVLRLEWRIQRTGTSTAVYAVRVSNNQTGAVLGEKTFTQGNLQTWHFREYLFGMSGQGGATFNGGSVYWGALAIRVSDTATDWIGTYPVRGVEQP